MESPLDSARLPGGRATVLALASSARSGACIRFGLRTLPHLSVAAAWLLTLGLGAGTVTAQTQTHTVTASTGDYYGPYPVTPPYQTQTIATFTYRVLSGETVVGATATGYWGILNWFDASTAPANIYINGVMVAQCLVNYPCSVGTSDPEFWTYTFGSADYSKFAGGQAVVTALQTSQTEMLFTNISLSVQLSCVWLLSTNTVTLPAAGGSGSIAVTTGCSWTASSTDAWLNATSVNNQWDGTVTYNVGPNPGTTSRVGTISVGDQTITITQLAGPTVASVNPNSGQLAGGNSIIITGTNFVLGATEVTVGGAAAKDVTVNASTRLKAITPSGTAGAADVIVTTAGGSATLPGGFTYRSPPTITEVTPNGGPTSGGHGVTITGTAFVAGATSVTFGGVAATGVTVASPSSLSALEPAMAAGAVTVAVTTTGGSGSLVGGYTYYDPPTISQVAPNVGPSTGGATVTIAGGNFVPGYTSVLVGGANASSVTVTSATSLTAVTPPGAAGMVPVTVVTPGGSATLSSGYSYLLTPTVTSVTPSSGPLGGGTAVTITGTGFLNGATVAFGSVPATGVSWVSATSLTATTSAQAAGAVAVVVTNPNLESGSLPAGFTYGPTTTTLTATPNPAALGQAVTFVAVVTAAAGGAPTGALEIAAGVTQTGGCNPVTPGPGAGQASCTQVDDTALVHFPSPGTYQVVATYLGNATFAASVSNSVPLLVYPLTLTFTDDPLTPRSTVVKQVHIAELRQAIDTLRLRYALTASSWTDASLTPGTTLVKVVHVTELRAALADVYTAAGRPIPVYSHATLVANQSVITATDIAEIRAALVAIW
jgi:hypothetical protein